MLLVTIMMMTIVMLLVLSLLLVLLGEAWLNYFETDDLRGKLRRLGFSEVEDPGPRETAARYFPNRASTLPDKGGHVLRATTV